MFCSQYLIFILHMIIEVFVTASSVAVIQAANSLHVSGGTEVGSTKYKTSKIKEIAEGFVHLPCSAFESNFCWKSVYLKFKHSATEELQKEVMNHKLLPLDI